MTLVDGLVSRRELNRRVGLVLGPRTESGRVPCCIAPLLPTEDLVLIAVKPDNLRPAPHPASVMSTAWNNAALAYKRACMYPGAETAFELACRFAPPDSRELRSTLQNRIKNLMTMRREGVGEAAEHQVRTGECMGWMFKPITNLTELRGKDCCYGMDFVPGYSNRQLHVGITGGPGSQHYERQWIYDPTAAGGFREVPNPGEMSGPARKATDLGTGAAIDELD
jgi:hypothetical protein